MIAGETTDYSTALLSINIYDPAAGCYNISNMTYPRMKHTATYYNSSDVVILIEGVEQEGVFMQESEFISINNAQLHSQLVNLEGYSVTTLGDSVIALIFDDYNGTGYCSIGLIADGMKLTSVDGDEGDNGANTFATGYLYYVESKTFKVTGSMQQQCSVHAAVQLSNGLVLIIGRAASVSGRQPANPLDLVERYDYTTYSFTSVAPLNVARYRQKAVISPNNNEAFVFGGVGDNNNILSSFEFINSGL